MGTVSFLGVKQPGRSVNHPPLSSAEVKERVELYLYSPSGPSWPILGRTLHFYHYIFKCLISCTAPYSSYYKNVTSAKFWEGLLVCKSREIKTLSCHPPELRRWWFRNWQMVKQDDVLIGRDRLAHKCNVKMGREVPDNLFEQEKGLYAYL
jgi:hypothetical protein